MPEERLKYDRLFGLDRLRRSALEQSMTTSQLISNHLLKNGVSWHPLSESFNDYRQACVDGREHRPVIGTPGGDMGILLLMISAGEKVLNREFSESEISVTFLHI